MSLHCSNIMALTLAFAAAGCGAELGTGPEDDTVAPGAHDAEDDPGDPGTAGESGDPSDASARLAIQLAAVHEVHTDVSRIMAGASPEGLSPTATVGNALSGVRSGLERDASSLDCMAFEVTGMSAATVTFTACDVHGVPIDGSVSLEVDIEPLAAEVVVGGATAGLTIGDATVTGAFELRVRLLGGTIDWTSNLSVTTTSAFTFGYESSGATRVVGSDLVTSSEAVVSSSALPEDLRLTAVDMTYSLVGGSVCPSSGIVAVESTAGTVSASLDTADIQGVCSLVDMYLSLALAAYGI